MLARAQAKSVSEEQTEKGLTLEVGVRRQARVPLDIRQPSKDTTPTAKSEQRPAGA